MAAVRSPAATAAGSQVAPAASAGGAALTPDQMLRQWLFVPASAAQVAQIQARARFGSGDDAHGTRSSATGAASGASEWKRTDRDLLFVGPARYDGSSLPVSPQGFGPWFRPAGTASALEWTRLQQAQEAAQRAATAQMLRRLAQPAPGDPDGAARFQANKLVSLQQALRRSALQMYPQVLSDVQLESSGLGPLRVRPAVRPRVAVAPDEEFQRKNTALSEHAAAQRTAFLQAVMEHNRNFKEFHRVRALATVKLARSVKNRLDVAARDREREAEREERARLRALKSNDMEAYSKMLESAKNQRLTYLLQQTDEFLGSISALVSRQVQESEEAPAAAAVDGAAAAGASAATATAAKSAAGSTAYYNIAHKRHEEVLEQPKMLQGGTLKAYQLAGLQWLVSLYNNNLNGILADEMGLGKTIQTISLLAYLMEVKGNNGPFLVVVPLSTLSNWANELEKWAPDIKVVQYKGTPPIRKAIYHKQIASGHYNVLLTTYNFVMKDRGLLHRTKYQYIIIDEGHRMKNAHCKFSQTLGQFFTARHRILLTGTPLQNSLPELWALLNFLLPKIFNSVDNFEQWFNKPFAQYGVKEDDRELSTEESMLVIHRLHSVLRPFLLRRVKSEVLGQLPEKVERVLRCDLSGWQKVLYRQIRDHGGLMQDSASGKVGTRGLANIVMQLRKVCNHPFLFYDNMQGILDDRLYRSSSKFELLDRMLPKLQAAGHKVLLFSQMTKLIDIMADFLTYRGFRFLRLDGNTTAAEREQRMHMFNAPDSPYFIFVLSTRAGGLGINLATADTVILFDSDWNPAADLQAQDRAHRIGQNREVLVFRLATNTPLEDRILSRAHSKRNLEQLVIEAGQFGTGNKSDADERRAMLEDLLKADIDKTADDDVLDDEQINEMMLRDEHEFDLFQQMDAERLKREAATAHHKPRLMGEDEVPKFVLAGEELLDKGHRATIEAASYGRGARARSSVAYNDNLTERQFMDLVESGDVSALNAASKGQPARRGRGRPPKSSYLTQSPAVPPAASGNDDEGLHAFNRAIEDTIKAAKFFTDVDGEEVAALFWDKPSKQEYPDYYRLIDQPIALNDMLKKARARQYTQRVQVEADVALMVENARTYNEAGSLVIHCAEKLQSMFLEQLQVPATAEEMPDVSTPAQSTRARRGRPPGSKNKNRSLSPPVAAKRQRTTRRGRGGDSDDDEEEFNPDRSPPRSRGRPRRAAAARAQAKLARTSDEDDDDQSEEDEDEGPSRSERDADGDTPMSGGRPRRSNLRVRIAVPSRGRGAKSEDDDDEEEEEEVEELGNRDSDAEPDGQEISLSSVRAGRAEPSDDEEEAEVADDDDGSYDGDSS